MALKIRLRLQGRKNRPFYRLVVADGKTRRDGKYTESVGWYDPFVKEEDKNLVLINDRIQHWLDHGAILSEKAVALVARGAPEIIKKLQDKELLQKAKAATKRKERNKAN